MANSETVNSNAPHKKRYAFVMELDRCIDCEACMVSCSIENMVPVGMHRNWVINTPVTGTFPNLAQEYVPGNCMHCENPPCVNACPTGASYQREDGIVLIDQDICIGCKYCIAACPYDARYYDAERGVVDKCTACVHRLDEGQPPACVETCIGGARHFGDINDPNSDVAKLLATGKAKQFHPETGTGPMVFYIAEDSRALDLLPVSEKSAKLTHMWQKLEQPAAATLLGSAVLLTGVAYKKAHENAKEHFAKVEAELKAKQAEELPATQ